MPVFEVGKSMKIHQKTLLATMLLLSLSAGTVTGVPIVMQYSINTASFSPLFGATNPSRAIQYAVQQWAAYGGSRIFFELTGSTTQNGCASVPFPSNHFVGVNGTILGDTNCGIGAQNTPCWNGSFVIEVPSCPNYTLGAPIVTPPPNPISQSDFHEVVVHEIGHTVLYYGSGVANGHVPVSGNPDDQCVMDPTGVSVFTGFCSVEAEAVGGVGPVWGDGYLNTTLGVANSAGFPSPTSFGATSASSQSVGVGGFDFQRGKQGSSVKNLIAANVASIEPHRAQTCEANGACSTSAGSVLNGTNLASPALVHDTRRNQWWMIARNSAHNNYAYLYKGATSGTPMSWTSFGAIPDIITMYPVAATYDYLSDSIVVVWNNGRGDVPSIPTQPGTSLDCTRRAGGLGGTQPFGCQGEFLVTLLEPVNGANVHTSRFLNGSAGVIGYTGLGAPAVVCERDGYHQCEAFVVSRDGNREIVSWRFQLFSRYLAGYQAQLVSGGTTDLPIHVSTRALDGTGAVVQSVLGSGDRAVYFRSRICPACNWTGWVNAYPGVKAVTAPKVSLGAVSNEYKLVVGFQ